MKTYMTIAAMVVLTLAFGLAYADEFPVALKDDAGTVLYIGAFPIDDTAGAARDFGVIGADRSDAIVDVGTALYNDRINDSTMASSEVKGSAAGGLAKEDENTRIWDDLLKPTGGSDAP
jgi:hypothetical protein